MIDNQSDQKRHLLLEEDISDLEGRDPTSSFNGGVQHKQTVLTATTLKDSTLRDTNVKELMGAKSGKEEEEEKKPEIKASKTLSKYLRQESRLFAFGTVALLGNNVGELLIPLFIGEFIDIISTQKFEEIWWLCGRLLIVVGFASLCTLFEWTLYDLISARIARNLRFDLYSAVITKDVEFFDSRKTGDLLSRLGSDIEVIQEGLSSNVAEFIKTTVFILVSFVFLFYISWQLTLTTLISILPVIVFGAFFGEFMKKNQKIVQDKKALIATMAEESFANVRTVKAFSNEREERRKFAKVNDEVYKVGFKKALISGVFQCFANFFFYGSVGAILLVGGLLCQKGELSVGQITTFLFYMIQILINFMIISDVFGHVMSVLGAAQKVVELLEYKPKIEVEGGLIPEHSQANNEPVQISLSNVTFEYPTKQDVQVLKEVTIDVERNKVIAIVGASGCGKSSIISMIERFYDPTQGAVKYQGQDIRELNPRWYHQQIAIVSQEPVLFSGTIRENIVYGLDSEVTEHDLDEACRNSNAYDFVHDKALFPDGYETLVGERGVKLSGGQKQRIAIARALIRKPRILLLDEATSALDAESEHQVQKALDLLIKSSEQTVIVIAHRLSTIKDADEIIVMQKGQIAERGCHDVLVKNEGGVYRQLVERQLTSIMNPIE